MRTKSLLAPAAAILSIVGCHGGGDDATDAGPTASAGADQSVAEHSVVRLAGAGTSTGRAVAFAWSQVAGPSVTLSNTAIANPTFTAPLVAIGTTDAIELRLEVTDSAGAVASDSVRISVRSSDQVLYTDVRSSFAGMYVFDVETNSRTTLVEHTGFSSSFPRISPAGSRIAYIDDAFDVWSVRMDGTGRVNLGSSRARGYFMFDGKIHVFSTDDVAWSPDGTHIVYSADRDLNDVRELYVVRTDGSGETQLPYELSFSLSWSPDGGRIGFRQSVAGAHELVSIRPDGTDVVKLTDATLDAVSGLAWSPDSARIAYSAAAPSGPPGELSLFTVRADGTARTRVLEPDVLSASWLPTGSLVATAVLGSTSNYGLFTVPPDGSALTKLSGPVAQGHFIGSPSWPRDASRVLFGIFESAFATGTPWPPGDLFTVRPDGTGLVRLNDARLIGKGVGAYWWAPDGSRIIYRGPQATGGVVELFSVRPDGTGRARLNPDLPSGAETLVPPSWSPDSSRVVVLPEQFVWDGNLGYGARDAFAVRADGTNRVKLNAPLVPRRTVGEQVDWAPDGSRLIFYEYQFPPGTNPSGNNPLKDTFVVLPDGTGRVKLNPDTASEYSATWSPDGSRLLYLMTDRASGRMTLGIARPDGTGLVPIKEWSPGEGVPGYFRWVAGG
jgi:Tol biopolymer transport system component